MKKDGRKLSYTVAEFVSRYGLGDRPDIRRRLYAAIAAACSRPGPDGEAARAIVGKAMQAADRARNPGRWFCVAVPARLREAGLWAVVPTSAEQEPPTLPYRRVGDAS